MNMKFCPKCKGLLTPSGEKLRCKCGYEEAGASIIKGEIKKRRLASQSASEIRDTTPVIETGCPKCKNKQAYYWTQQMRASDEPETAFYRCTKCGHTWREY